MQATVVYGNAVKSHLGHMYLPGRIHDKQAALVQLQFSSIQGKARGGSQVRWRGTASGAVGNSHRPRRGRLAGPAPKLPSAGWTNLLLPHILAHKAGPGELSRCVGADEHEQQESVPQGPLNPSAAVHMSSPSVLQGSWPPTAGACNRAPRDPCEGVLEAAVNVHGVCQAGQPKAQVHRLQPGAVHSSDPISNSGMWAGCCFLSPLSRQLPKPHLHAQAGHSVGRMAGEGMLGEADDAPTRRLRRKDHIKRCCLVCRSRQTKARREDKRSAIITDAMAVVPMK